jgi:hypothetical protein
MHQISFVYNNNWYTLVGDRESVLILDAILSMMVGKDDETKIIKMGLESTIHLKTVEKVGIR